MWRDQVILAAMDQAIINQPALVKTLANCRCVNKYKPIHCGFHRPQAGPSRAGGAQEPEESPQCLREPPRTWGEPSVLEGSPQNLGRTLST